MGGPNESRAPENGPPFLDGGSLRAEFRTALGRPLDELVDEIRIDQHNRWERSAALSPILYLRAFPELLADKERALTVLYSEVLLRDEYGVKAEASAWAEELPDFANDIRRICALHAAIGGVRDSHTKTALTDTFEEGASPAKSGPTDSDLRRKVVRISDHLSPMILAAAGKGLLPSNLRLAAEEHALRCSTCGSAWKAAGSGEIATTLVGGSNDKSTGVEGASTFELDEREHGLTALPSELNSHPELEFLRLLGEGGMGSVFLARQRTMDRLVAVKLLQPKLYNHPNAAARLKEEIRSAAKLHHPNIVLAYSAETFNGHPLFVMEYVPGASLMQYLKRAGSLPIEECCEYVRQAALGLQHAHESGVVHRDVKPQNLILTPQGTIKVLDFGLAIAVDRDAAKTGQGVVMGTADYIAPEQATNSSAADARSDIYSLGCTLYRGLTGQVPFPDATPSEKIARHVGWQPKPVRDYRPEIPIGLASVVQKMMHKEPAARYQSAQAVAEALAPFGIGGESLQRRHRQRRRFLFAGGAAVATSVLGLGFATSAGRRWLRKRFPSAFTANPNEAWVRLQSGLAMMVVAFQPGTNRVFGAASDGTLFAWDVDAEAMLWRRRDLDARAYCLVFDPEGRHAYAATDARELVCWKTSDWSIYWKRKVLGTGIECCLISTDRKTVYAGDGIGSVGAFHAADGLPVAGWRWNRDRILNRAASTLAQSKDGRKLFVGAGQWHDEPVKNPDDGAVFVVDPATGQVVSELPDVEGSIIVLSLSPDGEHLAAACLDGAVHVWNTESSEKAEVFRGHEGIVRSVAFAPDSRRIASSSFDGTVRVWELGRKGPLAVFRDPAVQRYNQACFSPAGDMVFAACHECILGWRVE
jgi:tRNA A-37 threonylcarbamoyl transferase component Bud32